MHIFNYLPTLAHSIHYVQLVLTILSLTATAEVSDSRKGSDSEIADLGVETGSDAPHMDLRENSTPIHVAYTAGNSTDPTLTTEDKDSGTISASSSGDVSFTKQSLIQAADSFVEAINKLSYTHNIPANDTALSEKCCQPTPQILFFLAFDEAHGLTKYDKGTAASTRSVFHNLEKVLSRLRKHPIFSLFMSTSSSLSGFAPPGKYHPSGRAFTAPLLAPFTEFPFDVMAKGQITKLRNGPGGLTMDTVSRFANVVRFGRPL
jgi:hypothetical protein